MVNDASPSMNPILNTLIQGAHDAGSPLFKFRGTPHLIKIIWNFVKQEWQKCIENYSHLPEYNLTTWDENLRDKDVDPGGGAYFWCKYPCVTFPEFTGININMMPFIIGDDFTDSRLPEYLRSYYDDVISRCTEHLSAEDLWKVCYLTIHESDVPAGTSQRRPGLHTEKSRKILLTEDNQLAESSLGGDAEAQLWVVQWGSGRYVRSNLIGGIYMATNLENSSELYNCRILDHPVDGEEIIGDLGDISHLRSLIPAESRVVLRPTTFYWITDRTPHQSLPLPEGGKRQFFRLVTHQVSAWYEEHSTPNPTGLMPDPTVTRIVKGSKFRKH